MTHNLLPLDQWRSALGYNPWHFWGCADDTVYPVTSKCNDVVKEYAWMDADQIGRHEIRQAIKTAESIFLTFAGFWPAPKYSVDTLPYPRFHIPGEYRVLRVDPRGRYPSISLREGYVQNIGIERLDEIELGSAVVWTDQDGDGLDETFTVTVATALTNTSEIAVYFSEADRLADDAEIQDRWRVQPVLVTISGGNAVITGKRWLVVKPALYESKANYPINSMDDTKFVSTLDVYRRYTYRDGTDSRVDSQSALIWEGRPCSWCDSCATSTPGSSDPSAEGWVAARSGIKNGVIGDVTAAEAVYNSTTGTWSHPTLCLGQCGEPDRVLVRYLAGYPLEIRTSHMAHEMQALIARLSAAEMTQRICACDVANKEWTHWQFDVSRVDAPETYQANLDVLSNPLGTRRGHIYAWQQIQKLARVVGILM